MKYSRAVRPLACALFLAAAASRSAFAFQLPLPEARPRPVLISATDAGASSFRPAFLRVDTALALIPVHVTTAQGRPVTDLTQGNFRLFEGAAGGDRVAQKITYFGTEDEPVSIGLLFDSSGSMRTKMRESTEAAQAFFKTANSGDEFFLVEFNDRPKLSVSFTPDSEELLRRIAHTRPVGRTSLLDAIHMGQVEMKRARNPRKALVILSDGGDNHSRYTVAEIRRAVAESDVEIYAMGIFDPGISEQAGSSDGPAPSDKEAARKRPTEERNGPRLLDELADITGGKHYPVGRLADLAGVAERIGNQLRSEYVLGYSPEAARDGKYHRVTVELAPAEEQVPPTGAIRLQLNYRRGFYGQGE